MRPIPFAIVLAGLSSVAFAKKAPPPRPVGNEAAFVESFSPVEVTIKATGVGNEPEDAELDIPRVAIEFVLFRWSDKILTTEDEVQQSKRYLDDIYAHPDKYVTWKADKVTSTRRLPDDRYEVTRSIRIHKGMLTDFFVSKGVLASSQDLAASVGNPSIAVIPDAPKGQTPLQVFEKNPLAVQCAGTIESYLTNRQYDVQSVKGKDQLDQQVNLISNKSDEDQNYKIALALGTDIYVTFSGEVAAVPGGRKASLVVKAYETTTARLLGTETGYSQTRPNALDQVLIEEATNDAIDKVLQRVNNYWKADAVRGIQYRVVLKFTGNFDPDTRQDLTDALEDLMDQTFKEHKETISTDKTADYLIWAPRDEFKTSNTISKVFRKKLDHPGVKIREITKNKKLIILEVLEG